MASFENSISGSAPGDYAAPDALREGRVMFSRYKLQRLLGRGGMGVVWLAHDRNLDRDVALKFLPEILLQDPVARDDMKNETRRSLQLTHPNIVRIYDFVEDSEAAAISMEHIDGATLSHLRIDRAQRCFEAEGLHAWVADLCSALEYAHRDACMVHRDLKPANLMITSRGSVKVADFGIARSLHNSATRVSAWNHSGGTLSYMSPQQLEGELASACDDIYSMGATLYELLTSKPPFHSGDVSHQIRAVLPEKMAARRIKLGVAGEPIPNHWEETIAACLSKNAEERPASAREVARLLGIEMEWTMAPTSIEPSTIPPRLTSPSRPSWRSFERLKGLSKKRIAMGACGSAALVGTALLWPRAHSARLEAVSASLAPAPVMQAEARPVAPATETRAGAGGVMAKTNPQGATVLVDGRDAGMTPLSISDLREGAHQIEVRMPGFDAVSMEAQVRPNEFTDLGLLTLQRSVGTVQITSQPEGSDYVLLTAEGDHEIRRGQTPDSISRLPTGDYRLRVTRPGWPVQEQAITVQREATRVASNRFGAGMIEVTTDPAGAEIMLDGKSLGITPLSAQLPNGHYAALTARLPDFQPETFSADLNPDETAVVPPIILKPVPPSLSIATNPPGIPYQIFLGTVETPAPKPVRTGETPADVDGLAPGAYRMILGGDRWPTRSVPFQIGDRGKTALSQDFPSGTVKVESQPPGADIYEGDVLLGATPATIVISPGNHTLVAEIEGRNSSSRSVAVAQDETKSVHFELKADSNGKGEGAVTTHHRRRPKAKPESELTKIGRTLKTFFFGKQGTKKPSGS